MNRRTPVLALVIALAFTALGFYPAQATAPVVTITATPTKIYPAVNTAKHPGSTQIVVTNDDATVTKIEVHAPDDSVVKTFDASGTTTVTWNGRDTGGNLVPAATYTILAYNNNVTPEAAESTATVEVSRQTLIRKTYIKTSAAARYAYKYVGKCSTLRKPSKRGWTGSLGYYANTKCKTQTWNASKVITIHEARMPVAERYVDVRVDTYGGAAKAKPRSQAAIEYWTNAQQDWTAGKFISPKVAWHNGLTRSPGALIDSNRWIAWRLSTAFKSQYDVAKFRVVLHYDVLSAS